MKSASRCFCCMLKIGWGLTYPSKTAKAPWGHSQLLQVHTFTTTTKPFRTSPWTCCGDGDGATSPRHGGGGGVPDRSTRSRCMQAQDGPTGMNDQDTSTFGSSSATTTLAPTATREELPVKVLVIGVTGGIGSGKSTACRMLVSDLCGEGVGQSGSANTSSLSSNTDEVNSFSNIAPAVHLDADSIAHGLYRPNSPAAHAIVQAFGPEVVVKTTGEVNRPALGAIIFNNPSARKKLEQIVWPLAKEEVWKRIQYFAAINATQLTSFRGSETGNTQIAIMGRNNSDSTSRLVPIVIVEAALLLEAGWDDFLDALWVVTASRDVALQRLVNGPRAMNKEDAERRMAAQEERPGLSASSLEQHVQQGVVTAIIDNSGSTDALRQALREALHRTVQIWLEKESKNDTKDENH
ncbi:hypothetical protein ACA910_016127 [Epithemia clementina (nom. ined.)]